MVRKLNVAVLGYGPVGKGVLDYYLTSSNSALDKYRVTHIGILNGGKEREVSVGPSLQRDRTIPRFVPSERVLDDIISNSAVDVVVVALGGQFDRQAREYTYAALEKRKSVVTCNKNNVSEDLVNFTYNANGSGVIAPVNFRYEACVCGGIPIIRALAEYFANDEVSEVAGIVNGTSNYILSRMHRGDSLDVALGKARASGFAENDPGNDLSGRDAVSKLAILASLAFKTSVSPRDIKLVEGIEKLTQEDIYGVREELSRSMGKSYTIKPLAVAKRVGDSLELRVHPAYISEDHPLFATDGATNAVAIKGKYSGVHVFKGPGAGSWPTGFAVWSDIFDIGERVGGERQVRGESVFNFSSFDSKFGLVEHPETRGIIKSVSPEYQIGTFAEKAGILAACGINIDQIRNFPKVLAIGKDYLLPDLMIIEKTSERNIAEAMQRLKSAKCVVGEPVYLREHSFED